MFRIEGSGWQNSSVLRVVADDSDLCRGHPCDAPQQQRLDILFLAALPPEDAVAVGAPETSRFKAQGLGQGSRL